MREIINNFAFLIGTNLIFFRGGKSQVFAFFQPGPQMHIRADINYLIDEKRRKSYFFYTTTREE